MSTAITNLVDLYERSCTANATRPLFGTKGAGGWNWITFGDFQKQVDALRAALKALGVGPGDKVGVVSNNRVEWAAAAYATYGLRAAYVPMYEAQKPDEWAFILADCGAKVVFGATNSIYEKLCALKGAEVPSLERVLGFELPETHDDSYAAALKRGAATPTPAERPAAEEVAGFIYTSGTTGNPKGVILSHGNIASNVSAVPALFPVSTEDRSLSFLPWAHSFGQTCELHVMLSQGAQVAINDDVANLVANLAEVKPTILFAVPRIFNRIYAGVNKQMSEKPGIIQALFKGGIAAATRRGRGEALGFFEGLTLSLADKLVFSKIREKFGGRLQYAFSGSAALNKEVAEFIDALGIFVYEGYGLTETSPIATANYPGHRKIGSVGPAIPGVTISIDRAVTGDPKHGEILIAGPNIMQGYHNRPEETSAVLLEDRTFRSGDMGYLDEDGYLYITGRIKEQYKLENGKYVVPSPLEEELKLSPFFANVMIYGDNKPHNVALVVPDLQTLEKWAQDTGETLGDVAKNPAVKKVLAAELERCSANFKGYEKPKDFAITTEDFTVENGLLTPTMKLKRRAVMEKYGKEIAALY